MLVQFLFPLEDSLSDRKVNIRCHLPSAQQKLFASELLVTKILCCLSFRFVTFHRLRVCLMTIC